MVLIQTMLNLFEILLKGKKWTNCSQPILVKVVTIGKIVLKTFLFFYPTGWQQKKGLM